MEHNKFLSLPKRLAYVALITAISVPSVVAQQTEVDEKERKRSSKILEEVFVTARKRVESLQETPVAVTAMGAEALREAGIASITDLQGSVPSLQFGESGSKTPAIFIRGVGQREATSVLDPGVGVYLNGIYIARQDGQLLDTVDTESIQVLRGPQGTLFGKNNTGGAILVNTIMPDTQDVSGAALVSVGNFGRKDLKLSGNLPLADGRAAMRLAINSRRLDGYFDNVNGSGAFADEDRLAVSSRFLWLASDDLTVDIFAYWSKQDELSTGVTCLFQNPDANVAQLRYPGQPEFSEGCKESEVLSRSNKLSVNQNHSEITMENRMFALTLDWSISETMGLKNITAFSWQDGINRNDDQDGTSIPILDSGTSSLNRALRADGKAVPEETRLQFSEELQLSGTAFSGDLTYTFGAFASVEEIKNNAFSQVVGPKGLAGVRPSTACASLSIPICGLIDDAFVFPLANLFANRSDLENTSWALFAQGTYSLTDYLQLTLGARYTFEERERVMTLFEVDALTYGQRIGALYLEPAGLYSPILLSQFNQLGNDTPDLPLIVTEDAVSDQADWSNFTPSATLSVIAPDRWVDMMHLDSFMSYFTYSEGFKAGGFEPKGPELVPFNPEEVVNLEIGFKLDALDSRLRVNAAAYTMSYKEIQVRVAEQGDRIADLYLYLSNAGEATINGAEIETTLVLGDWFIQGGYSWTDAEYQEFDGVVVTPGQGESIVDRSDEPFALVPEHTWSLSVSYQWLTPIGMITPRLSGYYRSELFTGIDYLSDEFESSYIKDETLWNFRLGWYPSEDFYVTAYINNLTDETYFKSGFAVSALLGAATLTQGAPRAAGLEFAWEF